MIFCLCCTQFVEDVRRTSTNWSSALEITTPSVFVRTSSYHYFPRLVLIRCA